MKALNAVMKESSLQEATADDLKPVTIDKKMKNLKMSRFPKKRFFLRVNSF